MYTKNIPNILTISRLVLIPFFLFMLVFDSIIARIFFLSLAIILSFTDFLDGFLARKYNLTSTFGRVFDPIADKVFILVLSIMVLVVNQEIVYYLVMPIVVILIRELVISGIREALAGDDFVIHVSFLAKYKTAFQMTSLCFLIIGGNENIIVFTLQIIGIVLIYISMILTLLTGIDYLKQSYKKIL